jgi:hypothetical protein
VRETIKKKSGYRVMSVYFPVVKMTNFMMQINKKRNEKTNKIANSLTMNFTIRLYCCYIHNFLAINTSAL